MNNINFKEKDEKEDKKPDSLGEKLLKSRIVMITDEVNKKDGSERNSTASTLGTG